MVLYRVFPFKYYIHELVSLIHFMMNSFSLVHVFIYGFMVAVVVGYDRNVPYILLYCYPYVIPTIPRCYKPQVVFSWYSFYSLLWVDLCVCVGCANNFFLPYRTTHPRIYLKRKNLALVKTTLFIDIITTTNRPMKHNHSKTLYKGLAQCIIEVQKHAYIGIIDIWCSCLVVWYYIFIWLLVLFGRCCTFFHLQGAFLTHGNYFRKIGAREKGGGRGISSVLFIFFTHPPLSMKQQRFICFLVSVLLYGRSIWYY